MTLAVIILASLMLIPSANATTPEEQLFEKGNLVQARYAKPTVNLTLGKTATASMSFTSAGETPDKAVNGTYLDLHDKWCTGYGGGSNQWLEVDLGAYYYIDRWVVINGKHIDSRMYTQNYRLEYKDGSNWILADQVTGNTEGSTDRTLPIQFIARYVRLYVVTGDFDDCTRIHEFQVYNSRGYVPMPGDILLAEDSSPVPMHAGIVYDSTQVIEAQAEGVVLENLSKWYNAYDSFWVKRIKNSSYAMTLAARNYAYSKLGYPYNYNFFDYKNTSRFYCTSLVYRAWRSGAGINLDSTLSIPPLTVGDISSDSDTYEIFVN